MMTSEEEGHEVFEEAHNHFENEAKKGSEPTIDVGVSLQAISGGTFFQTLLIEGTCKKQPITILIDSSSTHNFLDPTTAKQVGCQIILTPKLVVTVADGGIINTTALCSEFQWTMQEVEFNTKVRLLPLGGCDMVLCVQWLREVGPTRDYGS